MNAAPVEIIHARTEADLASIRELFHEYVASLGIDLEYQGFSAELASLPGQYAAPSGDLLLAFVGGKLAGCVALRALDPVTLEMKRLYVRPAARGFGLGKRLVGRAISIARDRAYRELRLDTLESMAPARALYHGAGFVEIAPYGKAYLPGTVFYGLSLSSLGLNESKDVTMSTGTVRLHRVLRTKPQKVYRAFLDADAMAKWLPPFGFTCKVHHLDARVGGSFKMSFQNFSTGNSHSFGGEYLELIPDQLVRYNDKFDDANLPGEMRVTVTLKAVSCGTDVSVVQEGIPEAIPVEMCYLGWQESLVQLANLVEPDIPG